MRKKYDYGDELVNSYKWVIIIQRIGIVGGKQSTVVTITNVGTVVPREVQGVQPNSMPIIKLPSVMVGDTTTVT